MAEGAFPTAEGYGAATVGGRRGTVFLVDLTIADNVGSPASGSLREAVEASGARYVMFLNGGTYALAGNLTITNPFITIAGESCPGDSGGVTLRDYQINIQTHEVIVRFIRNRIGLAAVTTPPGRQTNTFLIHGGGVYKHDIIIDHCDSSWATDQVGPDISGWTSDMTIQYSTIGEGTFTGHLGAPDGTPPKGHLLGAEPWMAGASGTITPVVETITVHHVWYHNVQDRCPTANIIPYTPGEVSPRLYGNPALILDLRNNLIHNNPNNHIKVHTARFYPSNPQPEFTTFNYDQWIANTTPPHYAGHVNVMGCLLTKGLGGQGTLNDNAHLIQTNEHTLIHANNNRDYQNPEGSGAPRDGLSLNCALRTYSVGVGIDGTIIGQLTRGQWNPVTLGVEKATPIVGPPAVTTHDVDEVEAILLANAGCIVPRRDATLDRWIEEVQNRTGLNNIEHSVVFGYDTLEAGTPPTRSQPDGIEDSYKDANSLSNAVDYTGVEDPGATEYDVIELYLHFKAGELAPPDPTVFPPINVFEPTGYEIEKNTESRLAGVSVVDNNLIELFTEVELIVDTGVTSTANATLAVVEGDATVS